MKALDVERRPFEWLTLLYPASFPARADADQTSDERVRERNDATRLLVT